MIFKILEIAETHKDGFTVELNNLTHVVKGISVAYAETQNSFDKDGLKRCLDHALSHDNKIGGWYDTESKRFYFDSVRVFKDTELNEAIEFGKENDQIAIFDITNLKEIRL